MMSIDSLIKQKTVFWKQSFDLSFGIKVEFDPVCSSELERKIRDI